MRFTKFKRLPYKELKYDFDSSHQFRENNNFNEFQENIDQLKLDKSIK